MTENSFGITFDAGALSSAIKSLDQALQSHIQTLNNESLGKSTADRNGQEESGTRPAMRKRKSTMLSFSAMHGASGISDGDGIAHAIVKRLDMVSDSTYILKC